MNVYNQSNNNVKTGDLILNLDPREEEEKER